MSRLGRFVEGSEIMDLDLLKKKAHSVNGIYEFGKDKTLLYKTGQGTHNGKMVGKFVVRKTGKFTDLTENVKGEMVYVGEKLVINIDDGELVGMYSTKPDAVSSGEVLDKIVDTINSQKGRISARMTSIEAVNKYMTSVINLITMNGVLSDTELENYANPKRSIIKKFNSKDFW